MTKAKILIALFLILLVSFPTTAQDNRPDRYDLIQTNLNLSIVGLSSKSIAGTAILTFKSKEDGLNKVVLDLLHLNVSSVNANGSATTYDYNDTILTVDIPTTNKGEGFSIEVNYSGKPVKDPSGWGGFYFVGDYAFNLGVGFESYPHNYGRAWYPTIDHFEERSIYSFTIMTDSFNRAMCNGDFVSSVSYPGQTEWKYLMATPIPSYLVSVAVAPYTVVKDVFVGKEKSFPVVLASVAKDTTKVKNSFANLKKCAEIYEEYYGPHKFDKIGFTMIPFNGGAMEHATNIAYPISAANGTLNRETLMAHEFAHHWWGNNITCETAEDMWINEGWASYSEALFTEQLYGKQAYKDYVRDNHIYVLRYTHIRDGGWRPIANMPQNYTYGSHVYDKGADVAHTLRWIMGDEDFKKAINSLMTSKSMQNLNSFEFRDSLQKYTSRNMNAFFENWVFEPGFPHFEIVNATVSGNTGVYRTNVELEQRARFTWKLYTDVPVEIGYYGANGEYDVKEVVITGKTAFITNDLDFEPVLFVVDPEEKISDAISESMVKVIGPKNLVLNDAFMNLTVKAGTDTSLIRIEHHWVGAKRTENTPSLPFLSKDRYWTVDGIFASDLTFDARITYDGRTPSNLVSGYLDNNLIVSSEDNLSLMYRAKDGDEWVEYGDYSKLSGTLTDGFGFIDIKDVKKGQYTLAFNDDILSIKDKDISKTEEVIEVYPNPSDSAVEIKFPKVSSEASITVTDITGKVVIKRKLRFSQNKLSLNVSKLAKGNYVVVVNYPERSLKSKIVVH
jgi:hypothetical protein